MTTLTYLIVCLSAAVCAVATVARAIRYARAPLHLRWELYPVPHEAPERAAHGGSRFEESDSWTRIPPARHWATLKAMGTEILLLKALRELNAPLWRWSYPFHLGLYLLLSTVAGVVATAGVMVLAPSAAAGWPGIWLPAIGRLTGASGLVLVVAGAAGLLHRRLTDPDLKAATIPADLAHLAAFILVCGVLGITYAMRPPDGPGPVAIVAGLLTWDTALSIPGGLAAGLALSALFAAYIPFTHMSHFVGKYFTYHAVRWDDAANRRGGPMERTLAEYLTYRPTWSARHVGADGTRTWADVATAAPPDKAGR